MTMLETIMKEFVAIVASLEVSIPIENDRLVVDRQVFRTLLEKYSYMTFKSKTKIYKQLNLIIHDKNNYTMPYKDIELNKTVRKVIINYNTYLVIKELLKEVAKK